MSVILLTVGLVKIIVRIGAICILVSYILRHV